MKFSDSHEWVLPEKDAAKVGITSHAQKELGEIVFIQLPKIGQVFKAGEEAVILESTKAAADIYSPVSGTVIAINEEVKKNPHLLNESPEDKGWLFKITLSDRSELDTLHNHQQYLELITSSWKSS